MGNDIQQMLRDGQDVCVQVVKETSICAESRKLGIPGNPKPANSLRTLHYPIDQRSSEGSQSSGSVADNGLLTQLDISPILDARGVKVNKPTKLIEEFVWRPNSEWSRLG